MQRELHRQRPQIIYRIQLVLQQLDVVCFRYVSQYMSIVYSYHTAISSRNKKNIAQGCGMFHNIYLMCLIMIRRSLVSARKLFSFNYMWTYQCLGHVMSWVRYGTAGIVSQTATSSLVENALMRPGCVC